MLHVRNRSPVPPLVTASCVHSAGESQVGDHGNQEEEPDAGGPRTNAEEEEEEDLNPENVKGLEPASEASDDELLKKLDSNEEGREEKQSDKDVV